MEKLVAGALAVCAFGLLVVAGAIASVVLRGWAASRADETAHRLLEVEGAVEKLSSRLKLVQGEWSDYHSKLDSLIRRGVRLGVLERKDSEAPEGPAVEVVTRSDLLKRYRERQKAGAK